MARLYLGLGANLGERRAALTAAIRGLRSRGVAVDRLSSVWETEPEGCPPGSLAFLNMVVSAPADGAPDPVALLEIAHGLERDAGRVRGVRNAPRTLDIDLLLHGDLVLRVGPPLLPHPRMHLRGFVLRPLAEIAPELVHPVLGETVAGLLGALGGGGAVRRVGPLVDPGAGAASYCGSHGPML